MGFTNLVVTDYGKAAMLKVIEGEDIIFTRIGLGNSEYSNYENPNNFKPKAYGTITSYKRSDDDIYSICHWALDTASVTEEFVWREYGLFASSNVVRDDEGNVIDYGDEYLFSYAFDSSDNPQPILSTASAMKVQIETDINITIGTSEHVSAIVGEYSAFALDSELQEHIKDQNNPHRVKAEDIHDLEDFISSRVDSQTPTITEQENLTNLSPGDNVKTIISKIKKLFSSYISHLSTKNPHNLKIEDLVANKNLLLQNGRYIRGKATDGKEYNICGVNTANGVWLGNDNLRTTHVHSGKDICFLTHDNSKGYYWHISGEGNFYPNDEDNQNLGLLSKPVRRIYSKYGMTQTSDRKLKQNISDCEIGLALLKKLNYINFNFIGNDEMYCGLIAQDVFAVMQELGIKDSTVYTVSVIGNDSEKHPELDDLSDEQIKKYPDEKLRWTLDYQQITNYCLAGFRLYMFETEQRLEKLENLGGGN